MPWVSSDDIGRVALDRMLRDGVLQASAPRHGAPVDVPSSPEDRARALRSAVPGHTVVSSLAGLWVRRGGPAPAILDVVGRRGLHRAKPGADAGGWAVAFHSGPAAREEAEAWAGVKVAAAPRCIADALRWADLAAALPVAIGVLRAGEADPADVEALMSTDDPRGLGSRRARSAWAAIRAIELQGPTRASARRR